MTKKNPIVLEKVKSRTLSSSQTKDALVRIQEAIALSPLLTQLGVYYAQRGDHIYLNFDYEGAAIHLARITPMLNSPGFALEYDSGSGWALYGQGTASRAMKLLCNDTLGTFHGLGSIDQTLRNLGGEIPKIVRKNPRTFAYKTTGLHCTIQEALHFYYKIPLVVVMEPREYYRQHGQPVLLEASDNNTRILIRFIRPNTLSPKILGYGYYTLRDGHWYGIGFDSDIANTLDDAEAYFKSTL